MEENKNYESENIDSQETEEAAAETAETTETAETAETAETTETTEAAEATDGTTVLEEAEEAAQSENAENGKTKKSSKKVGIIAGIIAVIVIAAAVVTSQMEFNKYNKLGYVNISGRTIGDICKDNDVTLEEFLEMYSLPEDMPASTTEAAAYYSIPLGKFAEMYGMDYDTLVENLNLGEGVTAETPWGEAEGEILLKDYVGEESIEDFKAQYELGDEITGETKWKDVRPYVDAKQLEARKEQEKAAAEAEKKAAEEAEKNAEDENADADGSAEDLSQDELKEIVGELEEKTAE